MDDTACCCGRSFKSARAMKIHRTKKGCLREKQREGPSIVKGPCKADEGKEDQETHHSVHLPRANLSSPGNQETKQRLRWPKAASLSTWSQLDMDLAQLLQAALRGPIDRKLRVFPEVVYRTCAEKFGMEPTKTERPPKQANRRQVEKGRLRQQQRHLKKRLKTSLENEKPGILSLLNDIRKKIQTLARAEYERTKRKRRRAQVSAFYRNPYTFTRKILQGKKSGSLDVPKEELEAHLRQTYSDPGRAEPLPHIQGVPRPSQPGVPLDLEEPRLAEVQEVVRKARASSAPGGNGIPYLLYKRCPEVLRILWGLLRVAWRKGVVPQEWCIAEGVFIPKEENSKGISQFRPISLLNIEGKIFFSILTKRLTAYLTTNGLIDTSVQKAGIPGFPGCLEHATMIWSTIRQAHQDKMDLHVVWLDLANAYGSVPHALISYALHYFWIPDQVADLLTRYLGSFWMRFAASTYKTQWQALQVGIPMGCAVSPLLFVMAMEVIIRGAKDSVRGVELAPGQALPPLRAFMDDITILSPDLEGVECALERLQLLIRWARMKFKPQKSRSLSLRKGKVINCFFSVEGVRMPIVREAPVKSLGRWYSCPITDRHRGVEIEHTAVTGLKTIDKCCLPGRLKTWCLQFVLIPQLLWPLQLYEVAVTRVEAIERRISAFARKWLGAPRTLTSIALYSSSSKLELPLSSIVEEFKVGKARLFMMLRDSADQVIHDAPPDIITGKKWAASEEVANATQELQVKEVMGATQTGTGGLGLATNKWFSREDPAGRRALVAQEIRRRMEDKRVAQAVTQAQQGQWTRWEDVAQRKLSWRELWHMDPEHLSFIIRSTYDLLPTPVNCHRWDPSTSDSCPHCESRGSLEHILAGCPKSLGKYTWRHNQVLHVLADAAESYCSQANQQQVTPASHVAFVREGDQVQRPHCRLPKSLLKPGEQWELGVDLKGKQSIPKALIRSNQRPDMVIWSKKAKQLILAELTVPWEGNMSWAHERKLTRYEDIRLSCQERGWSCVVFAVEVGCRGFVGYSVIQFLQSLGAGSKAIRGVTQKLQETAEAASLWVWQSSRRRS